MSEKYYNTRNRPRHVQFCQNNPFAYGIIFSNTMSVPNGFSGTSEWVQVQDVETREYQATNGFWYKVTQLGAPPYLDTQYPYPPTTNEVNVTADAPEYGQYGYPQPDEIIVSEGYTMWLMFKPNAGQWVPLRAVNWYWGAVATNSDPDSYSGWGFASSTYSPSPSDYDPGFYPEWNSNITNSVYTTNSFQ